MPNGPRGVKQTLDRMVVLARTGIADYSVRKMAESIISRLPQKDFQGEVKAVHAFVRDRVRYTLDPVEIEYLQSPAELLKSRQGDCDDKTILVCALLGVVGHQTKMIATGPKRNAYSHVFAQVRDRTVLNPKDPAAWVDLECTEPWPAGVGVKWPYRLEKIV